MDKVASLESVPKPGVPMQTGAGNMANEEPDRLSILESRVTVFATIIPALLLLGLILVRCRQGFDFTDEGYYLNSIAAPWLYKGSETQFGFIYHGLYWLLDGNVPLLRQLNVGITFALAWVLSELLLRKLLPEQTLSMSHRIGLAISMATPALAAGLLWLPTPSYNWLNLQALLLTIIGVVLVRSAGPAQGLFGAVLIGLGGWLALMAKPTTAVALGLIVVVYLVVTRAHPWKELLVAGATAAALTFAMTIYVDGSPTTFVANVLNAHQESVILTDAYSVNGILRWDPLIINTAEAGIFWAITLTTVLVVLVGLSGYPLAAVSRLILAAVTAFVSSLFILGLFPLTLNLSHGVWVAAVPLGVAVGAILSGWRKLPSLIRNGTGALIAVFVVLPFAYAFGTNNNLWIIAVFAAIFWTFAGMVTVGALVNGCMGKWMCVTLAAGVTAVTAVNVITGMEHPYRQPLPLRLQNDVVTIGGTSASSLVVAPESARYMKALQSAAHENGLTAATPVLDLTGAHPGTVYALGAVAAGLPWVVGGYPGSTRYATDAFDRLPCEVLGRSWLLVTPTGPRKLPGNLMSRYGYSLDRDYSIVARLPAPDATDEHILLKPRERTDGVAATCKRSATAN